MRVDILVPAFRLDTEIYSDQKNYQYTFHPVELFKKAPPTSWFTSNFMHKKLSTYSILFHILLDDKLNFEEHLKYITNKVNKFIGLLPKLQRCYQDDH